MFVQSITLWFTVITMFFSTLKQWNVNTTNDVTPTPQIIPTLEWKTSFKVSFFKIFAHLEKSFQDCHLKSLKCAHLKFHLE